MSFRPSTFFPNAVAFALAFPQINVCLNGCFYNMHAIKTTFALEDEARVCMLLQALLIICSYSLVQIEAEKYEGIVLKHCESKWTPDGSDKKTWIKIKPDYLPTEDLDCLVVGGNFGTGKRGGTLLVD